MRNIFLLIVACFMVTISCETEDDSIFVLNPVDSSTSEDTETFVEDTGTFVEDTETEITIIFDSDVNVDYEYYCQDCDEFTQCPDNGVCIIIEKEDESFCSGDCYTQDDCPGSLVCLHVYVISGICVPIRYNKTCEEFIEE